ncbi:HNH endonuclease, partial [Bacillus licheniformis]
PADMVHHIVEVKQDWSKRLDLSNLESLCNACHNKVHGNRSEPIK